jgi:hypothetical protein
MDFEVSLQLSYKPTITLYAEPSIQPRFYNLLPYDAF